MTLGDTYVTYERLVMYLPPWQSPIVLAVGGPRLFVLHRGTPPPAA